MKKIYFCLLFLFLFGSSSTFAFILSGKVTDKSKTALPFVNIMVKGTSKGCTTNEKGFYSFSLENGEYQLAISIIGYKQQVISVVVNNKNQTMNITMEKTELMLKEVVVNGNGEDPAYRIIREAQKKRKDYLEKVNSFSCDVYIKGLQFMKEIPEKVMGFKREDIMGDMIGLDSNGRGIIYLSESVSKFNFKQPDKIKEEMISSKVSGDNKAFSYNQASDMLFNFYENNLNIINLSERGFISPISSSAFLYYKFKLIGSFMENGLLVNKIEVIPKRKNDPVFHGFIYIIEDLWNIHSTDLYLTKDAQIDFVDTLVIQQVHAQVEKGIWLPVSNRFSFDFGFLGIKGTGYFLGFQSNYIIDPDFPKGFFNGEELKINDDANKKDSAYWKITRPVALTTEEISDYKLKDSLMLKASTKEYKDSVDHKRNKFKLGKVLLSGYSRQNSMDKSYFNISSPIFGANYNTVEGLSFEETVSYYKNPENFKNYGGGVSISYGIGNTHFNGSIYANYTVKPQKFTRLSISIGKKAVQFNQNEPIDNIINAYYTLMEEQNYAKIYEKQFVKASLSSELVNGIYINVSGEYADRIPMLNSEDFVIRDFGSRKFTSNDPKNPENENLSFNRNSAIFGSASMTFRIKQRYYTRPNQKVILGSKYPDIIINYKKGMGSVNYDFVKASIYQNINFKMIGMFVYQVSYGFFPNTGKIYFTDYYHFDGNQTIFLKKSRNNANQNQESIALAGFNLLPYYQYSTISDFLEAHAEHHFNGWIINKIPLIRKTKFKEVVGVHYLSTKGLNQYVELSVGIEKIGIPGVLPGFLRIDFVTAYSSQTKLSSGLRIGLNM
jgi:hypothetical protein